MSTMTSPRQLFLHELGDVLYAETLLSKRLPKLAGEATDDELSTAFSEHCDETKRQISRIEEVFSALGEAPEAERCPGIEGIAKEHDEFMSSNDASPEICDMFLTGAGARAEHYEIAAYTGLVAGAKALGEKECARILKESLDEERAALKRLETIQARLARDGG